MGGYREGIPLSIRLGSLGSVVSSPSEVRGAQCTQTDLVSSDHEIWSLLMVLAFKRFLEKCKTVIELSYSPSNTYDLQSTALTFSHTCKFTVQCTVKRTSVT